MNFSAKELYSKAAQSAGIFKINDLDLKRVHKVQLEILDDLIEVCKNEGLTVMLQAGTLIGAVLYKGFIPWDDDIDLFMPRKDYDRLLAVFPELLEHKYILQTPKTEPSASFGFMKIRKKDTAFVEVETSAFPMHKGIFIDVIPLENAPNSKFKRFFHGVGCIFYKQITTACALYKYPSKQMNLLREYSPKLQVFMTVRELVGFMFSFYSVGKWNRLTDKYCAKYKNKETDFISVPYSQGMYFKELYRKSLFYPLAILEFEGRKLSVPKEFDYILREKYGDYSIIPPPEKRTQHWIVELDFGEHA